MSIAGEVNSELRRRFSQFPRFGYPGHYINLPHGFRAECDPHGQIVLFHADCPDYPLPIGGNELHPYRWVLGLNWDRAAGELVNMLGLEAKQPQPVIEDELPF